MKNKLHHFLLAALVLITAFSCQNDDRPAVGNYPQDTNPPGGPLKFFVAFDGNDSNKLKNGVDSIRANFPAENTGASVDGVNAQAYQGAPDKFVQFGAANDFSGSTSFTVAFWLKKTPNPAGTGTNFVFGMNAKDYSWTNLQMFCMFEDGGQSTVDSAAMKFYLLDQWFEFVGTKRIPGLLDNTWHHVAFVYDETNSILTPYVDGIVPAGLPDGWGLVKNGADPRGAVHFSNLTGFTIGGPGAYAHEKNTWMGSFDGGLDQFRLYGTALTAAEVQELVASHQ
jgi:hypothetical protein